MLATDAVFPPPPSPQTRPPRPSATLVVVRDAPAGIEVLLSRRAERGDHNSGAWVFPGGIVDAGDALAHGCCAGIDAAVANDRLGLSTGALDYYVAAVRECFEESGLLFAFDASAALVRLDDTHVTLSAWRGLLHRGERTMVEFCREFGLTLALDRLVYLSHWLTPLGRAKRFDTRFFIAEVPVGQTAAFDGTEMTEQLWLRPADALARATELKLMTPTQTTLRQVGQHADVATLLAWARAPREIGLIMPRVGSGQQGQRPVLPDEPAWAEIGRLDPAGHGTCSFDIQVGVPVALSPRVIRVTAGNGSVMTGPGTNTYLVGGGECNEWAVIDPGPLDETHLAAILASAPGAIRWIFVTHTHKDHSPAALPLKAHTGAMLYGRVADHPDGQDHGFAPDVVVQDGQGFVLPAPQGQSTTLRAIHTPGHASNHLCFVLEEEKLLFTGDHVMQSSTVVINPPDGDMAAYLASLRRLALLNLDWLAPGHGFLMDQPRRAVESIIAHRLRREAKVLNALPVQGTVDLHTLLERVYDDVRPQLLPIARRSLQAHLNKLANEGLALVQEGHWSRGASPR